MDELLNKQRRLQGNPMNFSKCCLSQLVNAGKLNCEYACNESVATKWTSWFDQTSTPFSHCFKIQHTIWWWNNCNFILFDFCIYFSAATNCILEFEQSTKRRRCEIMKNTYMTALGAFKSMQFFVSAFKPQRIPLFSRNDFISNTVYVCVMVYRWSLCVYRSEDERRKTKSK